MRNLLSSCCIRFHLLCIGIAGLNPKVTDFEFADCFIELNENFSMHCVGIRVCLASLTNLNVSGSFF